MPSDCRGAGARAGRVQQRRPEGAEQGGVAGIFDQRLHAALDGGEEVGREVGVGVTGSGGRRLASGRASSSKACSAMRATVERASAGVPNSR